MCLDHSVQNILDFHNCPSPDMTACSIRPRYPIGYREYSTQIVRRMAPLSSQPAIVVVQPSYHRPNVEGSIDRVKDVRCPGYSGAIRNDSPFNDGAQKLGAFLEAESFEAAPDSVEEDVASSLKLRRKSNTLLDHFLAGARTARSESTV